MDTTKEYILMCERAKRIQELKKEISFLKYNDALTYRNSDGNLYAFKNYKLKNTKKPRHWIWLPCQDDLQEMVKSLIFRKENPHHYLSDLLFEIREFLNPIFMSDCLKGKSTFTTLEQLWLAFVMKVVYNKIWNGTDWIADKQKGKVHKENK